ncbi:hypothetical protein VTI28DRAFT_1777 [Corynascus sepedonium]
MTVPPRYLGVALRNSLTYGAVSLLSGCPRGLCSLTRPTVRDSPSGFVTTKDVDGLTCLIRSAIYLHTGCFVQRQSPSTLFVLPPDSSWSSSTLVLPARSFTSLLISSTMNQHSFTLQGSKVNWLSVLCPSGF